MNCFRFISGRHALLVATLFCSSAASAQQPRINFDLGFFRYGSEAGQSMDQVYKGPFLVFSDAKLGFSLTSKDVVHAGLRRQPNEYRQGTHDYLQEISNKGFEATIGYERNIPLVWKLCLLPELGFFYDKATMNGTIYRDMNSSVYINRKRTYTGAYLELKAGVKISAHIYILAGTRIRAGHVGMALQKETPAPAYQQEGNTVAYEPLSTLGFRYQL